MLHKPLGLLAELTHRCPLGCPYCSNPLTLDAREDELDTATWVRVFREAAQLGVLQVHLSGGEPGARRDLVVVNCSIPVILALVGTQMSFPAGDIWKVVIVYNVRFQNRMPCDRGPQRRNPRVRTRSMQTTHRASLLPATSCTGYMGASEQPSLARLVEIFGGVKPGWLTK
jgi:Radical SAM superfamily